ncbi:MAG: hypothetical protein Q8R96_15750 [Bacteroidota bacterium]|nr:hypothetical protein [Bacteroidota bacterium]
MSEHVYAKFNDKEITGLIDVATASKMYIKLVFGATSPQYKQVGSLKFTR